VQHLDPDRLVTLALGDGFADDAETGHLTGCAACRSELDALTHVADLGAETQGLQNLPDPPDRVWAAVTAGIHQNPDIVRIPAPATRSRPRRLSPVLAAAAAAILAVAGTVTVIRLTGRAPAPPVTAQAALAPLGTAPRTATGSARVLSGDEVQLKIRNLPLTTGYYEVWLIDPEDTTKMMALGNLAGSTQVVLPLPPGTDLNRYRLVDISAEAYDGNSAHSGKSLLRGSLTN
jgi:Anti-sigma-K factor rskA